MSRTLKLMLVTVTVAGMAVAACQAAPVTTTVTSTVTATAPAPVAPVSLKSIVGVDVNVPIKGTQALKITGVNSDGSTVDVTGKSTFNSYDSAIATVDDKGVVTGVGGGPTFILVVYSSGGQSLTTRVGVNVPKTVLKGLLASPSGFTLNPGQALPISVVAVYSDGSSKDVTAKAAFNPFDTGAAKVDKGVLTAQSKTMGPTKVMVVYAEGSNTMTQYVPFTVVKPAPPPTTPAK
ncbi:MAG: hypothetical protein HYX90_02875 [Chloroflexi bacterium]|nr:hypothetical protein [Chloroflexota bacterium]